MINVKELIDSCKPTACLEQSVLIKTPWGDETNEDNSCKSFAILLDLAARQQWDIEVTAVLPS
jgi:hypothetical protein